MSAVVGITGTKTKRKAEFWIDTEEQRALVSRLRGVRFAVRKDRYETDIVSPGFIRRMERAGFRVGVAKELGEVPADAVKPYGELGPGGREVIVHPRLAGHEQTLELAGWGAQYDTTRKVITMPLSDTGRDSILFDAAVHDARQRASERDPRKEGFEELSERLGRSTHFDEGEASLLKLPDTFTRELFAFQGPGALSAALGHRLIADPAGVGKTSQALAAMEIMHMQRIVVVCPPVIVTNWAREIAAAGVDETASTFRAGKKHPIDFSRVVIVPDSLLVRPEILQRLISWKPELLVIDEAHRMKNAASARSRAILDLAYATRNVIPMTATPIVSGPHELVPILDAAGLLVPVFGGADAFLQRYCVQGRFGLKPKQKELTDLHQKLTEHCMVRRKKEDILPFLPERFIGETLLEVPMSEYRKAVSATVDDIAERITALQERGYEAVDAAAAIANDTGRVLSPLRRAAAMLKVDECVAMTKEIMQAGDGPVVVWGHHKEPMEAAIEQLRNAGLTVAHLLGTDSGAARQRAIDIFEAGEADVIVASITAAGVGVTLTRSARALFLEADWSPAIVSQALDRNHRIGQQRTVIAQVLVALGTIDEHIQKVLHQKERTSAAVHGDEQDNVSVLIGDLVKPRHLAAELVVMALRQLGHQHITEDILLDG